MKHTRSFLFTGIFLAVMLTTIGCGGSSSGLYNGSGLQTTILGSESEITTSTADVFEDEGWYTMISHEFLPQLGYMMLGEFDGPVKSAKAETISTVTSDGADGTVSIEGTYDATGTSIIVYTFDNYEFESSGTINGVLTYQLSWEYEEGSEEPVARIQRSTFSNMTFTSAFFDRPEETLTFEGTVVVYEDGGELYDVGEGYITSDISYISDRHPGNSFKETSTWTFSEGVVTIQGRLYNQLRGGYLTISASAPLEGAGQVEFTLTGSAGGVAIIFFDKGNIYIKIDVDGDGTYEFDNTPTT